MCRSHVAVNFLIGDVLTDVEALLHCVVCRSLVQPAVLYVLQGVDVLIHVAFLLTTLRNPSVSGCRFVCTNIRSARQRK
ncbi:hypothetical protein D3C87_1655670 [compost metagenome]